MTEVLKELVNRYRRRTVFISASAVDLTPWGTSAVVNFAQDLGRAIVADGMRTAAWPD
ncbi:hypothetical protein [Bradyrhizobium sp. JR3.5]